MSSILAESIYITLTLNITLALFWLGKGWPLGSRLWCLIVTLSLSHWYSGSSVVLDSIDSWYLPSFLLCRPGIDYICIQISLFVCLFDLILYVRLVCVFEIFYDFWEKRWIIAWLCLASVCSRLIHKGKLCSTVYYTIKKLTNCYKYRNINFDTASIQLTTSETCIKMAC